MRIGFGIAALVVGMAGFAALSAAGEIAPPATAPVAGAPNDASLRAEIAKGIFAQRCVTCHGDRLVSSPLRLVPTDFRPPVDAELEPWSASAAPADEFDRLDPHRPASRPPAPRARDTAERPSSPGKSGKTARSGGAAARALRAARSTVADRGEPPVAVEPGDVDA